MPSKESSWRETFVKDETVIANDFNKFLVIIPSSQYAKLNFNPSPKSN